MRAPAARALSEVQVCLGFSFYTWSTIVLCDTSDTTNITQNAVSIRTGTTRMLSCAELSPHPRGTQHSLKRTPTANLLPAFGPVLSRRIRARITLEYDNSNPSHSNYLFSIPTLCRIPTRPYAAATSNRNTKSSRPESIKSLLKGQYMSECEPYLLRRGVRTTVHAERKERPNVVKKIRRFVTLYGP